MINVGNYWWFYCSILLQGIMFPSAQLQVRSTQGNSLDEVGVGVPWYLEVRCISPDEVKQEPVIPGLPERAILSRSSHVNIVMHGGGNRREVVFTYKVRIDEPMTLTLGPVSLQTARGTVLQTNKLTLPVVLETLNVPAAPTVTARLILARQHVVVGEPVEVKVQFIYPASKPVRTAAMAEVPPDWRMLNKQRSMGPLQQDRDLAYLEWTGTITPRQEGVLTIPALRIDYEENKPQNMMERFMRAVHGEVLTQHCYTNGTSITVDSLPATDAQIVAVGRDVRMNFTFDKTAVHAGDPLLATIAITSPDPFTLMTAPTLTLPEGFKCYPSRQQHNQQGTLSTHHYVLQGLTAGNWEIPPQHYAYFDTQQRVLVPLVTEVLPISVLPSALPAISVPVASLSDGVPGGDEPVNVPVEDTHHSVFYGMLATRQLVLQILLPLLTFMIILLVRLLRIVHRYLGAPLTRWLLVVRARRKVAAAVKRGDAALIYQVGGWLRSELAQLPRSSYTGEVSREKAEKLQELWHQIEAARFGDNEYRSEIYKRMCRYLDEVNL